MKISKRKIVVNGCWVALAYVVYTTFLEVNEVQLSILSEKSDSCITIRDVAMPVFEKVNCDDSIISWER